MLHRFARIAIETVLVLGLASAGAGVISASAQTAADADRISAEATRLYQAGKYAEAIPLAQQALAIREKALGAEHVSIATSLATLAEWHRVQGRFAEAEPLLKRSLAIYEKNHGLEHPNVAAISGRLGNLFRSQGRASEAEAFYKRALTFYEKSGGPINPAASVEIGNLAGLYVEQLRYAEAEPLMKRGLAILEKQTNPDPSELGTAFIILGNINVAQRRYAEADLVLKRGVGVLEKSLGPDHRFVAMALLNLATSSSAQAKYSEAETAIVRALAIFEKQLGPEHPSVAIALDALAQLHVAKNDWAAATSNWQRSVDLLVRRTRRSMYATDTVAEAHLTGKAGSANQFVRHIQAADRAANVQRALRKESIETTFKSAQWSAISSTATSLQQMAIRQSRGDASLAAIIRERQDLHLEWQKRDKAAIDAASRTSGERDIAAENANTGRMRAIDARIAEIDNQLSIRFPEFVALASPDVLGVTDVQSELAPEEALILILETDRWGAFSGDTFVWIVTKSAARWWRSTIERSALLREVGALRCGLDVTTWWRAKSPCPQFTGTTYTHADDAAGKPLPFDAARAHTLYRSLFGEAADLIRGKRLLVVPSGALTTLPLQVLVTEAPKSKDLAAARWLIRDHAITVLPSVASLKALRRTGKPSAAPKPMIGFGNPLLDGNQAHPRHGAYFKEQAAIARAQTGCAKSAEKRTAARRAVSRSLHTAPLSGGRIADLDQLRVQTPLPETADELCEVARNVGGSVEDVRIGARATESEVKQLSSSGQLASYRMLHFATHGTLAGQLSGTSEPGLILSPPKTATAEDDGYLSGSEIAALKLDADWVILSACNTAGGAGEGEAAEALSGLARAFFYAGARALLVSHWEVDSDVAVKLITSAAGALAKDRSIGRAEALRRAMLAVMADTTRPANWVPAWHPAMWAPFVVVGEGGRGR
jgi:CHAT domain-containing protein/tetratricopeptide (TPR) repeat protein